jgi:hypothetical protein
MANNQVTIGQLEDHGNVIVRIINFYAQFLTEF